MERSPFVFLYLIIKFQGTQDRDSNVNCVEWMYIQTVKKVCQSANPNQAYLDVKSLHLNLAIG